MQGINDEPQAGRRFRAHRTHAPRSLKRRPACAGHTFAAALNATFAAFRVWAISAGPWALDQKAAS
ncbi:MAG: hypothetical protein RLZZ127_980 [Planctomycetota bacterium]